ncbi:MAG: metal-dependent hydrolase [Parvibaculaceae bacterium]
MFIAHLPAGYLLTSAIQTRTRNQSLSLLATGLVASVLPDADLLWFYLVDNRQHVHHAYMTHTPVFWVGLAAVAWITAKAARIAWAPLYIGVALANLMLHMALDSIAAEIRWLWPLSNAEFGLFHIPAVHGWWVWNFVLHWTFLFEVAACMAALLLLARHIRTAPR